MERAEMARTLEKKSNNERIPGTGSSSVRG